MILVEIVEESARSDRMRRDLEIVDVPVPVRAYAIDRRDVLCGGHWRLLYYRGWLRRRPSARRRDLDRLTARTFDVLVVGGGIYGLTIAYDCAQRGLSVALIERDDFGSGASFNHLRTIHGGLRYLQTLDIATGPRVRPRAAHVCAHRARRPSASSRSFCRSRAR